MVKVKICGITNLEDALAAIDCGADALGFVFAPSPRRMTPGAVKDIVECLPPFVSKVGVFQNSSLGEIRDAVALCGLDLVQLHGNEEHDLCNALFPGVIKAFSPANLPELAKLSRYRVASYMLDREKGADTKPDELWPIACEMSGHGLVILAGALTTENVGQAIKIARPYAVDVSGGVEKEPGKKDHNKISDFIRKAKCQ